MQDEFYLTKISHDMEMYHCSHGKIYLLSCSICSEHASAETHAVTVSGVIQSRKLELMDSELSAPLQCVAFGSTYYGTVLTKKVVLYNNSPALTEFIAIFDEKALGTIQVGNGSLCYLV